MFAYKCNDMPFCSHMQNAGLLLSRLVGEHNANVFKHYTHKTVRIAKLSCQSLVQMVDRLYHHLFPTSLSRSVEKATALVMISLMISLGRKKQSTEK